MCKSLWPSLPPTPVDGFVNPFYFCFGFPDRQFPTSVSDQYDDYSDHKDFMTMTLNSTTKVNGLPVVEMIYGNKKFEAFFLKSWLTEGGMIKTILR